MAVKTKADIDADFEKLVEKVRSYRSDADVDLLRRSYDFAAHVHATQLRQSGEPYIVHPVAACWILTDIEADEQALAACMLHDTVEDCAQDEERELKVVRARLEELVAAGKKGQAEALAKELAAAERFIEKLKDEVAAELQREFGEVIFKLVEGVTRLSAVRFADISRQTDDQNDEEARRRLQAENLRRMVVAAAKDVRVLIIKLADRLHNMQTLYAKRRAKQIKIARESELIYAKLAERLGIWRIKWEMEDLALRYLEPEAFFEIEKRVARTREQRMDQIDAAVSRIQDAVAKSGIKVEVYGRPKHLYSIYHKMMRQGIDFDDIYDLEAIRVVCDNDHHCYMLLGIVHSLWPHQPEHFADYISNPKGNGYRSIHTKVIVPGHGPMEVQIRTKDMHREAEYGVAAHWRYKDDGVVDETFAKRLSMMRHLFEMARAGEDQGAEAEPDAEPAPDDFLREMEASLWDEEIFVYTPKGEVIDLPLGATVVDFAYRIHTQVGHTCIGAKVNRHIVPLSHVLSNGDQCEILRQRNTGPSRDWLKFVRTSTARTRIRAYLRHKERDTLVERGQQLLDAEAVRQRQDLKDLYRRDRLLPAAHRRLSTDMPVEDLLSRIARKRSFSTDEDLLTALGDRIVSAEGVVHQLVDELEDCERRAGIASAEEEVLVTRPPHADPPQSGTVSFEGTGNLMYRRSKCCLPLPGDTIIGYVTRGSGIAIHREDCPNVRHLREREPERVLTIEWHQTQHSYYDVPLEIRAHDRLGLLRDLTGLMSEVGVNILGANTDSPPLATEATHIAAIRLRLELVNRTQLDDLLGRLPALGVSKITIRGQVFLDTEKGTRATRSAARPKKK